MAKANSSQIIPQWWNDITFWMDRLGQRFVYGPENVAGWPGYRTWLNESTLTSRWNYVALVTIYIMADSQMQDNLRQAAITLTNNSKDPVVITTALVDFFTGQTLDPIYASAAVDYFKAGIPEGYFTDGSWNLSWDEVPDQIVNLLKYLARLPEFQLT
jgi:hypothetical protein